MRPLRTTLTISALTAAAALPASGPAYASAGLSTATFAQTHANGTIDLELTYECDGGGTGTITGSATENLVTGTGTASAVCDGAEHNIAVTVTPAAGSFTTPGSALISAVLVDAGNVTVATLPPTTVNAF